MAEVAMLELSPAVSWAGPCFAGCFLGGWWVVTPLFVYYRCGGRSCGAYHAWARGVLLYQTAEASWGDPTDLSTSRNARVSWDPADVARQQTDEYERLVLPLQRKHPILFLFRSFRVGG